MSVGGRYVCVDVRDVLFSMVVVGWKLGLAWLGLYSERPQ